MNPVADPSRLTDGLRTRWAIAETSFKFHSSCRHTHPAADALLALMREKAQWLAAYGGGAAPEEMRRLIDQAWNLRDASNLSDLLPLARG